MAPDIVAEKEYKDKQADIWTLGVILYAMLSVKFPFSGYSKKEFYYNIKRGIFTFPLDLSLNARRLIERMLCINPIKRPTCAEILNDPFITNKMSPMTVKLPRIRSSLSITARNCELNKYY